MKAIIDAVDRLIALCPPDMEKEDEHATVVFAERSVVTPAKRVTRRCYSVQQLHKLLDDAELERAIYTVNENTQIWVEAVRNFLIARLWEETRS